jgi:hypothetical protein
VEGLHPPGIFNSNEKRILPSAAIRKRIHFRDWPVYCRFSSANGWLREKHFAGTATTRPSAFVKLRRQQQSCSRGLVRYLK